MFKITRLPLEYLPTTFYNNSLNYKFYGTTPITNDKCRTKGFAIIGKTDIFYALIALKTPLHAIDVKWCCING